MKPPQLAAYTIWQGLCPMGPDGRALAFGEWVNQGGTKGLPLRYTDARRLEKGQPYVEPLTWKQVKASREGA